MLWLDGEDEAHPASRAAREARDGENPGMFHKD